MAVVGGGDTACEEATYLASLCRKVYMIVRRNVFRASKAMQERVFNTPNIEVLWEHQTKEIIGNDMGVTGAVLRRNDGTETTISIDGFFLAIGTSRPGIFAAGDVQDPTYRQAINAAASGCRAAMDAEKYLAENK